MPGCGCILNDGNIEAISSSVSIAAIAAMGSRKINEIRVQLRCTGLSCRRLQKTDSGISPTASICAATSG